MIDGIEKLNKLLDHAGFTKYQRQAFNTLFSIKEGTIEDISNKSGVPLPKTYEVMKELDRKGFVLAVMGRPQKYKAIPPEVAFLNFLKEKERVLVTSKKYVADVSKMFNNSNDVSLENIQLMRTKDIVLNFLANHLQNNVEKSYYACVAFRSPRTPLIEIIKEKIERGIDVKVVGCIPKGKDYIAQKYKKLGVKVRTLDGLVAPIRFSVYDNEYASFTLSDADREYVTIWTSSKPIVKTISDLFNHYWEKGSDF